MSGPGATAGRPVPPAGAPVRIEQRELVSGDGWRLRADVASPGGATGAPAAPGPAVLLVPATKHERDAFGPLLREALTARGFTVMAFDLRGRGDSTRPRAFHAFPPGQVRAVGGDVASALVALRSLPGVDPARVVVMTEQDTAGVAAAAAVGSEALPAGLVVISGHLGAGPLGALRESRVPVCGLVSKEDRRGLRDTVAAYAASGDPRSRLRVVSGFGAGTTMFSAWQYHRRGEPALEQWLAAWAGSVA